MYTLYYAPGAASMAVHWLLLELGVPHGLVRVDLDSGEQKRPAYLALNPAGVVPTLVSDGVARHEAAALLVMLADAHPEASLAPAPGDTPRAGYMEWMFHLANTVQPLFRQWWYPHEPAGPECVDAVRRSAAARIEAAWERIDAHLAAHGPHLLGGAVSAADYHLVMLMRWSRNLPRPALAWPHLAALAGLLTSRPSFAALCEREGLEGWP